MNAKWLKKALFLYLNSMIISTVEFSFKNLVKLSSSKNLLNTAKS